MTGKTAKIIFMFIFSALAAVALFSGYGMASDGDGRKAVLILAHKDFNNSEYTLTREILEKHGIHITVASSKSGKAKCMDLEVPVKLVIDELKVSDYDAIVFIGGFGVFDDYMKNPKARRIVKAAAEQKKILAGICAATGVIYDADVIEYKLPGPTPPGKNVRVEGNIILGGGPDDSRFFAESIVRALDGTLARQ